MTAWLRRQGYEVNPKRVYRLMCQMGIQAIYPKPKTSQPGPEHKLHPYLLRNLEITHVNQVWSADITYVPMPTGFMYPVAVMDWFSCYVLSWQRLLPGGTRAGPTVRQATNFQHRPGQSIYCRCLHRLPLRCWHSHQYGWPAKRSTTFSLSGSGVASNMKTSISRTMAPSRYFIPVSPTTSGSTTKLDRIKASVIAHRPNFASPNYTLIRKRARLKATLGYIKHLLDGEYS
jgi:hypothetical protein